MRLKVLRDRCAGHALCNATAPQLLGLDEEGQATLLVTGDIPPQWADDARAAANTCPEQALEVEP
jgi:ferredoxin